MLYDVHTHIGIDAGFYLRRWWPYCASVVDLLSAMDASRIDRAVCFPFTLPTAFDPYVFADRGEVRLLPDRHPFDRENEILASEINRLDRDRRLLQFAMFDPSRAIDLQLRGIDKIRTRIAGLKTQSTVLQSPIRALLGNGRALMEYAQAHDLPVLIHTAVLPVDSWAQAKDCLEVAETFPKVRFNLAHSLRFHREHLKRAARMPNVWIDCSAHLIHCRLATKDSPVVAPPTDRVDADYFRPADVLIAIHNLLGGKYLWGSDNPYMSWCADAVAEVFSYREEVDVLHALPERVRDDMATRAPKAWLFGGKQQNR